jgi:hypothetical protein
VLFKLVAAVLDKTQLDLGVAFAVHADHRCEKRCCRWREPRVEGRPA